MEAGLVLWIDRLTQYNCLAILWCEIHSYSYPSIWHIKKRAEVPVWVVIPMGSALA